MEIICNPVENKRNFNGIPMKSLGNFNGIPMKSLGNFNEILIEIHFNPV